MRSVAAPAVLALFTVACGRDGGGASVDASSSGSGGGGPSVGPAPALAEFCGALSSAWQHDCSCDHRDPNGDVLVPQYLCDAVARDVADGTLVYDATKAQACVDAIAAANSCTPGAASAALPDTSVCAQALQGRIAQGQPCRWGGPVDNLAIFTSLSECASGLFCAYSDNVCTGTCRPKAAHGQECPGIACGGNATGNCQTTPCADPGDFCQPGSGTCEAIPSLGQACGSGYNPYGPCTPGLYCAYPPSSAIRPPGVCQAQVDSGMCNPGQPLACGFGTVCTQDGGVGFGQCEPFVYAKPGEACGSSLSPQRECACGAEYGCGAHDTCVAFAEPGSPYLVDGGLESSEWQCHDGYCDRTGPVDGGLCRAFVPPGSACDAAAPCGAGTCDTDAGRCVPTCYSSP